MKIINLDEAMKPRPPKEIKVLSFTIQKLDEEHWGVSANPNGDEQETLIAHDLLEAISFIGCKALDIFTQKIEFCQRQGPDPALTKKQWERTLTNGAREFMSNKEKGNGKT